MLAPQHHERGRQATDGWWAVVVTGWVLLVAAAIGLSVTVYEVIDKLMKHVDGEE